MHIFMNVRDLNPSSVRGDEVWRISLDLILVEKNMWLNVPLYAHVNLLREIPCSCGNNADFLIIFINFEMKRKER